MPKPINKKVLGKKVTRLWHVAKMYEHVHKSHGTNPMNVLLSFFLEFVELKSQPVSLVKFRLFAVET